MRIYFFLLFLILAACNSEKNNTVETAASEEILSVDSAKQVIETHVDTLGDRLRGLGLVSIHSLDSSFRIDLKYASEDNFLRENLYGNLTEVYLQKEVAVMLAEAHNYLHAVDSTLFFLIYDGVRPLWVQQRMWDLLDSIPVNQRVKFVSNPKNGSLHNFGCAVDLTLCDAAGIPLDMGAGYDDMRKIAYPELERYFLETGELTREQYQNRLLLRKSMRSAGFSQLPTEWWHYNAMSRETARQKYELVK